MASSPKNNNFNLSTITNITYSQQYTSETISKNKYSLFYRHGHLIRNLDRIVSLSHTSYAHEFKSTVIANIPLVFRHPNIIVYVVSLVLYISLVSLKFRAYF